jgi:peptide deformylase
MAVMKVLEYPDPRLRTQAAVVTEFGPELRKLTEDMFETMYDEQGIGLAATQVDVHQRVVVIDLQENVTDPLVLINPTITQRFGETISEEGCLSVPEFRAEVKRAERIEVEMNDLDGNTVSFEADGLLAICIQHELDHLKGIVFVDHLSRLKQERYRKRLAKLRKAAS